MIVFNQGPHLVCDDCRIEAHQEKLAQLPIYESAMLAN
jgi:hypothetical protein